MKTKFTRGPWEIKPEECGKNYIRVRGTVLGGKFKVANVMCGDKPMDWEIQETRGNAHLIAAAPDGFAIAEAAYIAMLKMPHDVMWRTFNQHIYAGLRDYIAKATNQDAESVQNYYEQLARES